MPRMFLHGLEGSSQGFKAQVFRGLFPDMLIPDMQGTVHERLAQVAPLLAPHDDWMLVGSSFGGLMAALWACAHPQQVQQVVLLAPALHLPEFAATPPAPVAVPTVLYHGVDDTVVPLVEVRPLAEQVFRNLTLHIVDDNHRLQATFSAIDWRTLLA